VNQIVHKSNDCLEHDPEVCIRLVFRGMTSLPLKAARYRACLAAASA
jgi:hypothetical protein